MILYIATYVILKSGGAKYGYFSVFTRRTRISHLLPAILSLILYYIYFKIKYNTISLKLHEITLRPFGVRKTKPINSFVTCTYHSTICSRLCSRRSSCPYVKNELLGKYNYVDGDSQKQRRHIVGIYSFISPSRREYNLATDGGRALTYLILYIATHLILKSGGAKYGYFSVFTRRTRISHLLPATLCIYLCYIILCKCCIFFRFQFE